MDRKTLVVLATIFAVALFVFIGVVWLTSHELGPPPLWLEVARAALQVMVIGVLGTALKLLGDDYQVRRHRADERDEFRRDKYRRLVGVTSALREVQVFTRADPSVKTWSDRMPTVLKADADLRQIKHEIYSTANTREPPFPNHTEIIERLERMFGYTTLVAEQFATHKQKHLFRIGSFSDLVQTPPSESTEPVRGSCAPSSTTRLSWAGYQEDEACVLHLMLEASFGSRRRQP